MIKLRDAGRHRARGPRGARRHRAAPHRGRDRLRPRRRSATTPAAWSSRTSTSRSRPARRWPSSGPTGAGKSTLAKLVTRFYDPTAGPGAHRRPRPARRDHALAAQPARRGPPGAVPVRRDHRRQHRLRPARRHRRARSARRSTGSGSTDVIERMPDGLDTVVHERGQTLSSGERQLHRPGPGLPGPSPGAGPRRGHLQPRPPVGDEDRSRPRRPAREPHRHPHRPPAVDGHAGRPDRGGRRRAGSSRSAPHDELVAAGGRYAEMYDTWIRHAEGGQREEVGELAR